MVDLIDIREIIIFIPVIMHNKVTKGEVILIEGVTMERDVVEALESSWQNAQPSKNNINKPINGKYSGGR